jgi:hypothetical protein
MLSVDITNGTAGQQAKTPVFKCHFVIELVLFDLLTAITDLANQISASCQNRER